MESSSGRALQLCTVLNFVNYCSLCVQAMAAKMPSSDLQFQMEEAGVFAAAQQKIYGKGFTCLPTFAGSAIHSQRCLPDRCQSAG